MARDEFDFDAVDLKDGGFYHSDGDTRGNMMIGFGRRGRNKWVQLSQPEISHFLAHGHEMLRTDDPAIKGVLADLAALIHGSKPRWADLNTLLADVPGSDDARKAAGEVMEMVQGGTDVDAAIAKVNANYAAKPDGKARAVPKK